MRVEDFLTFIKNVADEWLLENQLPLFILNELFELAKNSNIR